MSDCKWGKKVFFNELSEELMLLIDKHSVANDSFTAYPLIFKELMKIAVERKSVFWDIQIQPYKPELDPWEELKNLPPQPPGRLIRILREKGTPE